LGKERRHKRQRQLDMTVAAIQRQYGPWALVKGDRSRVTGSAAVPHIPTGFPALDRALGIGGLPQGRVCELVGPATSGKTTLALKFLAQAQAVGPAGGQVGYLDQALYFDPDYAHRCGLDLSRLLVGRPQDVREALAMTEALAHSGGLAALAFDALDFTWTDPAAASLLAATFDRLTTALARSGTVLIVLHELPVGNATSGGSPALSALAHVAAVRLGVVRERWLHDRRPHGDIRGYQARVEVLKNRFGPAGRTVSLAIEFNGTVQGNGL
jgi:recombination protein RecA